MNNKNNNDTNEYGSNENDYCNYDPCLWLCFPCLFTWMVCEKCIQSCCMCCLCVKVEPVEPNSSV